MLNYLGNNYFGNFSCQATLIAFWFYKYVMNFWHANNKVVNQFRNFLFCQTLCLWVYFLHTTTQKMSSWCFTSWWKKIPGMNEYLNICQHSLKFLDMESLLWKKIVPPCNLRNVDPLIIAFLYFTIYNKIFLNSLWISTNDLFFS